MAELITYDAWINGDWYQPIGGEYFDSVDPTSGKAWARIARCDKRDVDHAVKAAKHAFVETLFCCKQNKLLQQICFCCKHLFC